MFTYLRIMVFAAAVGFGCAWGSVSSEPKKIIPVGRLLMSTIQTKYNQSSNIEKQDAKIKIHDPRTQQTYKLFVIRSVKDCFESTADAQGNMRYSRPGAFYGTEVNVYLGLERHLREGDQPENYYIFAAAPLAVIGTINEGPNPGETTGEVVLTSGDIELKIKLIWDGKNGDFGKFARVQENDFTQSKLDLLRSSSTFLTPIDDIPALVSTAVKATNADPILLASNNFIFNLSRYLGTKVFGSVSVKFDRAKVKEPDFDRKTDKQKVIYLAEQVVKALNDEYYKLVEAEKANLGLVEANLAK